jgi:mono/diheme cytochrome c family protein
MRSLVLASLLVVACGKGDTPPPPSSSSLLLQESGPSQGGSAPRTQQSPQDAKTVYANQCAMCHGPNGKGDGVSASALAVKPRDYTDAKWQASVTDDELKKIIVLGGKAVGKAEAMPPNPTFEGKPELLDGLVKIIRGFGGK